MPNIRLATAADLPDINAIYNHYVIHSTCTYQEAPSTAAERQAWFDAHGPEYPITVAVDGEKIVAWGSLSRFHPRAAYRPTVENSVYVRDDCRSRGLGRLVLADLIARAESLRYHSIMALISADQEASIRLHASMGFIKVGYLAEVGRKFDCWLDVAYMQKMLPASK